MESAKFYLHDPNAPKPNHPTHVGVCTMLLLDDTVLLEHRADNDSWGFVGGGIEIDESLRTGASREILEETGIYVPPEDLTMLEIFDHPQRIAHYPDGNIIRLLTVAFYTRLRCRPTLVCSAESRALRFFTRAELTTLPIVETHRDVLDVFLREWTR